MILPPWVSHLAILLVVQFDGSLRAPRDVGFPTKNLGRLASCSAAILSSDGRRLAVGGKILPLVAGMTSADVEMEGLLMALAFLCKYDKNNVDSNDKVVLFQGDCKTVIDQMNGDSLPRRLESKFKVAKSYQSQFFSKSGKQIRFQHIMRDSNTFCDALCAEVMNLAIEQETSKLKADMQSDSKSVANTLSKYFGSNNSIIPFSKRLGVYHDMLTTAREAGDGLAIQQLGAQLGEDAKLWPASDNIAPRNKQSLAYVAIRVQIEGFEMLNKKKEVKKLLNKHRFVLNKYSEQSEVYLLGLTEESEYVVAPALLLLDELPEKDTEALATWRHEAREVFFSSDESMQKSKRKVWVNTK